MRLPNPNKYYNINLVKTVGGEDAGKSRFSSGRNVSYYRIPVFTAIEGTVCGLSSLLLQVE